MNANGYGAGQDRAGESWSGMELERELEKAGEDPVRAGVGWSWRKMEME